MRRTLLAIAFAVAVAPLGAQATATVCKDGSSSATSGRGACSGHGGVDSKATGKAKSAEKKAEKTADKADVAVKQAKKAETKAASTEVTCSDGSKSPGGRGACSGHGGIGKSNPAEKKAEVAEKKADVAEKKADVAVKKADVAQNKAPDAVPATRSTPPAPSSQPRVAPAPSTSTAAQPSSRRREDNDATGAIAKCKDGMYSHSANRRGACSRHGGVATWM